MANDFIKPKILERAGRQAMIKLFDTGMSEPVSKNKSIGLLSSGYQMKSEQYDLHKLGREGFKEKYGDRDWGHHLKP